MAALQYVVEGGSTLSGTIRPSGNKNAALPIVAAALLCDEPVTLENVPRIRDVETLVELIRSAGVSADWKQRNTLLIDAKCVRSAELDPQLCRKIRASILLAAPMLARCGEVTLPPPGGDVIGRRRLDTHFLALQQLGTRFDLGEAYNLSTKQLRGADIFLDEPSVTGTENALMAAVAAKGVTVLRNAASEPHVQDLAHFLIAMGATIEGIGTNELTIQSDLGGHIPKLEDQPWPAFPADVMSIAIVTATQCEGVVMMHEKMFESRMFFVDKLIGMGARIILCDPHRAVVVGPSRLRGAQVESPDIRAGMAILLAA